MADQAGLVLLVRGEAGLTIDARLRATAVTLTAG